MTRCPHPTGFIQDTGETTTVKCKQSPTGFRKRPVFLCLKCGARFTANHIHLNNNEVKQ